MRSPRQSARWRFTVITAALIIGVGGAMLAATYLVMKYVPTYDLSGTTLSTGTPLASAPIVAPIPTKATAIGVTISSSSDVLTVLLSVSAISLVVIGAAGAFFSWIAAGRMLRPLAELNAAADRAASGSLSHRVPVARIDDEFGALSHTFNRMLERLETSFSAHERFAANASHELRTPLATTRTLLAVHSSGDHDGEYGNLLAQLTETNERSIEIVEAMLDLSDVGSFALETTRMHALPIVRGELDRILPAAATRGISVTSTLEPITLDAHPALLRRVVANLLDNAVTHNVDGGSIRVELIESAPCLVVTNTSDALPSESIERLAEPFSRGRALTRRSDSAPSTHGLGLAPVAGIARAHGWKLELASVAGGGFRATIDFVKVSA